VCARSSLFSGNNERQATTKELFRGPSGDHETLLNVHEAWVQHDMSQPWCEENHVEYKCLTQAQAMLRKVHKTLAQCKIPITHAPSDGYRIDAIVQALCEALSDHVAVANDPNKPGEGFILLSGYSTNPVKARIHPSSAIRNSEEGIEKVIFQNRKQSAKGSTFMSLVTKVTDDQLVQAGMSQMDDAQFQEFKDALKNSKHVNESASFAMKPHERNCFNSNIKDLRNEFPMSIIKSKIKNERVEVTVSCAQSSLPILRQSIASAYASALDAQCDIILPESVQMSDWIQKNKSSSLTEQSIELRNNLRSDFGIPSIQFVGNNAERKLTVTALGVILHMLTSRIQRTIGGFSVALSNTVWANIYMCCGVVVIQIKC
jgi:hypothetical protein